MVDFQYYINRQGPQGIQGLQGEKGDDGKTPVARQGTNNATTYTVIFDSGDGNVFETANLRPAIADRGGTTLRYDRVNLTQYLGEPDEADLSGNPGIVYLADTVRVGGGNALNTDAVSYELFVANNDTIDARLDDDEEDINQAQLDIVSLDNRMTTAEGNITSLGSTKADKATTYTKTETNNLLNGKANVSHTHTKSQITDFPNLATVATSGSYNDLINKPTIPTVGNGTITITQGGVSKGTFTTNQSGDATIALDAGGGSSFIAGTGLELTAQDVLNVKIDGTTITTNTDGQLVASGGGTTYTAGTGIDITNDIISVDNTIVDTSSNQTLSNKTFDEVLAISEDTDQTNLIIQNTGDDNPRIIMAGISSANQRINVVDGQFQSIGTIAYTSDITGGGSTVLKKTITQASANVSVSSNVVTVTDADVTTSTLVSLYPGDTTTETWLSNNLDSTIITEGTGSFTFNITASSLPSTFSMYYTITEVS